MNKTKLMIKAIRLIVLNGLDRINSNIRKIKLHEIMQEDKVKLFNKRIIIRWQLSSVFRAFHITASKARPYKEKGKKGIMGAAIIILVGLIVFSTIAIPARAEGGDIDEKIEAYRVIVANKEIGIVTHPKLVEEIFNDIHSIFKREYGMPVNINIKPIYQKAVVSKGDITGLEPVREYIAKNTVIDVDAVEIRIDGFSFGYMKDAAQANIFIEELKLRHGGIDAIESKTIEDIIILPVKIEYKKIMPINDAITKAFTSVIDIKTHVAIEGDSIETIADEYGVSIDDIINSNPRFEAISDIKPGMELMVEKMILPINVISVYLSEYEKTTDYKTKKTNDKNMYKGQTKVTTKGVNGSEMLTDRIVSINGAEDSRETIKTETVIQTVNKVVAVGTKSKPVKTKTAAVSTATAKVSSSGFIRPTSGKLTSPYGYRRGRLHKGIDIANKKGTPIKAAKAGRVIRASYYSGYGNSIDIDHGGGVVTRYAHLSKYSVKKGQQVSQGQLIGKMGSTGNSTGSHLHFEVIIKGVNKNPSKYLK